MRGAKRAVQPCCTIDLQRRSAPKAGEPNVHVICKQALSRAIQLCVDIGAHMVAGMEVPPPCSMGQTFDILEQAGVLSTPLASRLRKAVGFRTLAVHNDDAINWHIVFNIAHHHLADFTSFAKVVMTRLDAS